MIFNGCDLKNSINSFKEIITQSLKVYFQISFKLYYIDELNSLNESVLLRTLVHKEAGVHSYSQV